MRSPEWSWRLAAAVAGSVAVLAAVPAVIPVSASVGGLEWAAAASVVGQDGPPAPPASGASSSGAPASPPPGPGSSASQGTASASAPARGAGAGGWHGDLARAREIAARQRRPLMVVFRCVP